MTDRSLWDDPVDQRAWDEHERARDEHDAAIRERDRAIEKAERGADPLWIEEALQAVEHCARSEQYLTSEDAARLLDRQTHEPRAWGAVFVMAKDKGWITATDRFVPATHPSRHCAPIRTWRSNLYVEEQAA